MNIWLQFCALQRDHLHQTATVSSTTYSINVESTNNVS